MKITMYHFLKKDNGYKYIKDDKVYYISSEMFECLKRQYLQMGYHIINFTFAVSFSKAQDDIQIFLKQLHKK